MTDSNADYSIGYYATILALHEYTRVGGAVYKKPQCELFNTYVTFWPLLLTSLAIMPIAMIAKLIFFLDILS